MKKLLTFLLLLFLINSVDAQYRGFSSFTPVYNDSVKQYYSPIDTMFILQDNDLAAATADSFTSRTINLARGMWNRDYAGSQIWEGDWGILCMLDSLEVDNDADSLCFLTLYNFADDFGWFRGDTITWTLASSEISIDSTKTWLVPGTDKDLTWWWAAPNDSGLVKELGYEEVKIRCIYLGDSTYCGIKLNWSVK